MTKRLFLFFLFSVTPVLVLAHKSSDSYLTIEQSGGNWEIAWDIALRDLEDAIGLDTNQDGRITRSEVESQSKEILGFALGHLEVTTADSVCNISPDIFDTLRRDGDAYITLALSTQCADSQQARLRYDLFFDRDPTHTALVQLRTGDQSQSHALSDNNRDLILSLNNSSAGKVLVDFFREGVWHIWIGFDHVLFLITLLLPAVLVVNNRRWDVARNFKSAFFDVVKIVTAFTIAHSVTLALASLEFVSLPSRFVESAIALSVFIAAVNNVWPAFSSSRWQFAFVFGLIHGFGFANVLQVLDLPAGQLASSLLGFNLGVEIGQLAIVVVFLPLAWVLRYSVFYQWGIVRLRIHYRGWPGNHLAVMIDCLIKTCSNCYRAFRLNIKPKNQPRVRLTASTL